jgi:hypothetical protein
VPVVVELVQTVQNVQNEPLIGRHSVVLGVLEFDETDHDRVGSVLVLGYIRGVLLSFVPDLGVSFC